MNKHPFGAAIALATLLTLAVAPQAAASALDHDVFEELNFARTRPFDYARKLEHEARPVGEDGQAVREAIAFLRVARPLPPLQYDPRLAAAAQAHTIAQGASGEEGHVGPGGQTLGDRLQHHRVAAGLAAENISYGYRNPADVVRQLIVDEGVPSRGHRKNIFAGAHQAVGVSCGPHRVYGAMCVIDFAGALVQR